MADNYILLHYGTKSWSQQIVDSATLFATRVKYVEILQEQVAGLIIFSFTLSTCIYIKYRSSYLLTLLSLSGQQPVTKVVLIKEIVHQTFMTILKTS